MSFVAGEIAWLLEEALPERIGGGCGDYQLAEERTGSLSRIMVVVDPGVAAPADDMVIEIVLELFASLGDGQRLMAEQWRQAGALRVSRRAAPRARRQGPAPARRRGRERRSAVDRLRARVELDVRRGRARAGRRPTLPHPPKGVSTPTSAVARFSFRTPASASARKRS